MGTFREAIKKMARPQVAAGLLALLILTTGYWVTPAIIRPAASAPVPVIKPLAQVQGAAIVTPVDCSKTPCLALTFDDGPKPRLTRRVLDVLRNHQVRATFFLIGLNVRGNENVVRRIHSDGHEIGNHSWSHRKFSELSPREIEDEIARTQRAITATGVPTPRLFRPPYGDFSPMVRNHVSLTVVSWNVDPEDWRADHAKDVIKHVLDHARPGAIVDMHDIYSVTADALGPILDELTRHYQLVTVSELLDLSPGQPGIFYGR
jgi:peptidoglycan/xylan/chitin deacetylase (PgdA/CDA1 family)